MSISPIVLDKIQLEVLAKLETPLLTPLMDLSGSKMKIKEVLITVSVNKFFLLDLQHNFVVFLSSVIRNSLFILQCYYNYL